MEIIKNWFSKKKKYIGFEDVKYAATHREHYIIINTLAATTQECLITGTLPSSAEESVINKMIDDGSNKQSLLAIILYGRHSADESVETKADQLANLGFDNVFIYGGGLFEWLLLQDIYGFNEFPTTTRCKDFLQFSPAKIIPRFSLRSLTYG